MITLDHEKSQEISDILHTLQSTPRNELHLTDDPKISCPLKAFCRLTLIQPHYSRRTSAVFIRGLVYDELFKRAFKATEVEKRLGVSVGHPDVLSNGWPVEAKHTTRVFYTPEDLPGKWVYQTKLEEVYCEVKFGWLCIGDILSGVITAWKISLVEAEFDDIENNHLLMMESLKRIIQSKDPELLDPIRRECALCFYNHEDGCPKRPRTKRT